jgi:hypothetical protein
MSAPDDELRRLIRRPDGGSAPCKACGASAPPFAVVSFHRASGRADPPPGQDEPLLQHQRCPNCGLIFTCALDHWSEADFRAHIYNAGYVEFDPDYVSARALKTANLLRRLAPARREIRMLDYGGGSGLLAEELRKAGLDCQTYDPFSEGFRERPAGRFNLISCIETFEHLPRPRETVADIVSFADDKALIVFSTLVQPPEIETIRRAWWYFGPRNGHITFYTSQALAGLWAFKGFGYTALSAGLHLAVRNPPWFGALLSGQPSPDSTRRSRRSDQTAG